MAFLRDQPPPSLQSAEIGRGDNVDNEIRQLCAACLSRAIRDALGDTFPHGFGVAASGSRGAVIRQAVSYINSDDVFPYSFVWVCDVLNFDRHKVRQKITEISTMPEVEELLYTSLRTARARGCTLPGRTRIEMLLAALLGKRGQEKTTG